MSYNSKRTGQEVENLLDEIDNKVDKVDGKQLSTEDFTTALKDKLNSLNNYDDTEINEAINTLREDFDALVGGDTTTAIKSFNEVIAFLDGISDTQDLAGIISSIEQQIATKMDKTTLATVATSGNYNDLTDKPTIPSEVTESTVSNWGFTKNNGTVTSVKINGSTKASSNGIVDLGTVITEHQDISGKVDKVNGKQLSTEDFTTVLKNKLESLNNYDDTSIQQAINTLRSDFNTLVGGNTTTAIDNFNEIIAFLDGITDSQNLDNIIASIQLEIAKKQVALISGTNIKTINGQSILGSGNIQINSGSNYELPAATTTTRGGIKIGSGVIVDNTDVLHAKVNESTGLSITNNGIEIKLGTGLKVGNQNRIETNLKTINGQAIEGSGNIEIQGGGGSSSGNGAYVEVDHGTSDTIFTLTPNTFHVWDEVASLDLTLGSKISGIANEYLFQFTSGSTATTLSLPDDIKWIDGEAPNIEPNIIYQVSILKSLASVLSWDNAPNLIENHITYNEGNFMDGGTITFEYPTASELILTMLYYSSSELIIPQGTTNMAISWNEPQPPIISNITPLEDLIYKYVL